MHRLVGFILIFLVAASCSRPAKLVDKQLLFPFEIGGSAYFPKPVLRFATKPKGDQIFSRYFPASFFASALRMLDEKSLLSSYQGREIVRLTRTTALGDPYFTIRIENSNDKVSIIHKESYRIHTTHNDRTEWSYRYDQLEFDSSKNEYQFVSYHRFLLHDSEPYRDSISVAKRRPINPIMRNEVGQLDLDQWNHLVGLLNSNSYLKMSPVDSAARFDGYDYLLEVHTEEGYYVVDRFAPDQKEFLKIIEFILNLVDRKQDDL